MIRRKSEEGLAATTVRGIRAVLRTALRHTCASLLLVQGLNPRLVMELLGHSQINLTLDTYSHVIPTLRKEAANEMDALIASS